MEQTTDRNPCHTASDIQRTCDPRGLCFMTSLPFEPQEWVETSRASLPFLLGFPRRSTIPKALIRHCLHKPEPSCDPPSESRVAVRGRVRVACRGQAPKRGARLARIGCRGVGERACVRVGGRGRSQCSFRSQMTKASESEGDGF